MVVESIKRWTLCIMVGQRGSQLAWDAWHPPLVQLFLGRLPFQVSDLSGRIIGWQVVIAKDSCYYDTSSKELGAVNSKSSLSQD